ncbi:hypothetical protein KOSB73_150061 [Klebsiella grimontii]|uniref:Uncharacterized protein n=1 Tax=Klebsiella grimontii TaxID=2058152 RepID=A0A285AW25_9ENTR|nr:hypothetical protein KOSB73_150061 [Klebsiella grimontii]
MCKHCVIHDKKTIFSGYQGCKPDVFAAKGLGNTRKRVCGLYHGATDRFLASAGRG